MWCACRGDPRRRCPTRRCAGGCPRDGWQLASAEPHLKGGRSGVAILARAAFQDVRIGPRSADLGAEFFDQQGRYLEVDLPGGVTVGSLYIHTGEAGTERQVHKERFMAELAERMAKLSAAGRDAVLCGDGIAHTENDIKAWKANVKKAGFLPGERQWLTDLIRVRLGGRAAAPASRRPGPRGWWSVAGRGLRQRHMAGVDYHLATETLAGRACRAGGEAVGLRDAVVRPCSGDR